MVRNKTMKVCRELLKKAILDGEKVIISPDPAFKTHINYVWFFEDMTNNLKIQHNFNIKKKITKVSDLLNKKVNLIKLIVKSLNGEYKLIKSNIEFSEICVPWIAVKAYYLIFNSLLILEYLIRCNENFFKSGHKAILEKFKNYIENKEISFNNEFLNRIIPCVDIERWKLPSRYSVKPPRCIDPEIRFKEVIRKLFFYKLQDFQRDRKIDNFKTKKSQELKQNFVKNSTLNLSEFFYWYRIKSNYRDLEFLDKDINTLDFFSFYRSYFNTLKNFYTALRELSNSLAITRVDKKIL